MDFSRPAALFSTGSAAFTDRRFVVVDVPSAPPFEAKKLESFAVKEDSPVLDLERASGRRASCADVLLLMAPMVALAFPTTTLAAVVVVVLLKMLFSLVVPIKSAEVVVNAATFEE